MGTNPYGRTKLFIEQILKDVYTCRPRPPLPPRATALHTQHSEP